MIFKKEKLLIKYFLIAVVLLVFGFSKYESDDDGLGNKVITTGTKDTILYMSVDNVKVPVYLSIPKNCNGKQMPAIVVMHGSGGMWTKRDFSTKTMSRAFREWQSIFNKNCIVGAFVDSYNPRGVAARTGKWKKLPHNFKISTQFVRPKDANTTLALLQNLKYDDGRSIVDGKDIAVMGFSDGAGAVASTLMDTDRIPKGFEWKQSRDGKKYGIADGVLPPQTKPKKGFSAGVFYYGGSVGYNYWGKHPCGSKAMKQNVFYPYAPILYNVPENGYLTKNTLCMVNLLKKKNAPVKLNLYKGVGHGFDRDDVPQSKTARKKTIKWLKQIWSNN